MQHRFASFLAAASALALCAAPARADDPPAQSTPPPAQSTAPPAQTKAQPPPQGGGDGARPRTASMVIEEESAPETPPPPPEGEEKRLIGEYVRAHSDAIQDCYEGRLKDRKTLQGKLTATFVIGPNGRVIGAAADGIGDRELIVCVVKVVRSWEFEKPQSGGKLLVRYPWRFTPQPVQ